MTIPIAADPKVDTAELTDRELQKVYLNLEAMILEFAEGSRKRDRLRDLLEDYRGAHLTLKVREINRGLRRWHEQATKASRAPRRVVGTDDVWLKDADGSYHK